MKTCTGCLLSKSEAEFNWKRPGQRKSRCRTCQAERYAAWLEAMPDRRSTYFRARHRATYVPVPRKPRRPRDRVRDRAQGAAWRRTWQGFESQRWAQINHRTVNGAKPYWTNPQHMVYLSAGIELRMTRDQFREWCRSRAEQIEQMYRDGLRPSIDRIDGTGHYAVENLQLLPLSENCRKRQRE